MALFGATAMARGSRHAGAARARGPWRMPHGHAVAPSESACSTVISVGRPPAACPPGPRRSPLEVREDPRLAHIQITKGGSVTVTSIEPDKT
eukprot:836688-Prymnesium_polylepis.1